MRGKLIKGLVFKTRPNFTSIDCSRNTIVGNIFYMKDESYRNEVCDKYEIYFKEQMNKNIEFKKYIRNIWKQVHNGNNVELLCYCGNKRCHCETIINFVEKYL